MDEVGSGWDPTYTVLSLILTPRLEAPLTGHGAPTDGGALQALPPTPQIYFSVPATRQPCLTYFGFLVHLHVY